MTQRNLLDVEVGPFYDVSGVAALLGVTATEVAARRRAGMLLAVARQTLWQDS